jgi:hypothetical protein
LKSALAHPHQPAKLTTIEVFRRRLAVSRETLSEISVPSPQSTGMFHVKQILD